ncbi:MAG: anthranilate synthase component I [Armatimonadetes bacterium]|nr:anthranilate synthase component I [Armatimonadota bacterium]
MLNPSYEEYAARGKPQVVWRDLLADLETPLSAYWKLAADGSPSYLLESVTGGENLARYSILGVADGLIWSKGDEAMVTRGSKTHCYDLRKEFRDALDVIKAEIGEKPYRSEGLPDFVGGVVGMLAYDFVRFVERLPDSTKDDLELPDAAMLLTGVVVVFDHAKNSIRVMTVADGSEEGYRAAAKKLEATVTKLAGPLPALPTERFEPGDVSANTSRADFETSVRRIKKYIEAGDGIQMVPSLRFETAFPAHPITLYRALRSINPSPYMFLLRFGDFDLVGASPELHVSLDKGVARVRPIAGTRPRGKDEAEDARLAEELLADVKERAEHIMLVDLGRNDLGRVAEYGSVKLNEMMLIERYSHVMHIVSDVTCRLRPGLDGYDLIRATFPAGTVSGAPKVRAMQIIDELEPTRRGSYAGAVGVIGFSGDTELAIAIRTVMIKGGKAYVQAGAGIVFDSDPASEYEECCRKARGPLQAIEVALRGM